MSTGLKANADGSAAIQVGGSDAITITSGLAVSMNGGVNYPLTSGTAVASTSGTSIDFTGIPSTAKRITVMFNGVSTSGTSNVQIQIGAGSVTTSGYVSNGSSFNSSAANSGAPSTSGFLTENYNPYFTASAARMGQMVLTLVSGNIWVSSSVISSTISATSSTAIQAGSVTLAGTLDRVRITTVNGTDTFDAGSINILWE